MSTIDVYIDRFFTPTCIYLPRTSAHPSVVPALIREINSRPGLKSFEVLGLESDPSESSLVLAALEQSFSLVCLGLHSFGNGPMSGLLVGAIGHHRNLQYLDVGGNGLRHSSSLAIAGWLRENVSLAHLCLGYNNFGDLGIEVIALSLRENSTLHNLELTYNDISPVGASHLSEMLRVNTGLKRLRLTHNRIACDGTRAIADSLTHNDTLLILDIGVNRVREEGTSALCRALLLNTRLQHIVFGYMNFGGEIGGEGNILGTNGGIALAASIGRPGLRHVSVAGCMIRDIGTVALSSAIVRSTCLQHLEAFLEIMRCSFLARRLVVCLERVTTATIKQYRGNPRQSS
jgi:Leucine-rich repeat (LRR) protein